ncbi:MAG TPA: hypothetical protein VJZ93_00300 [Candidatus Nanoarchaeia archaeon]|nr:hypothetical protein [Candidatus Nanoarchaeia archaeon]
MKREIKSEFKNELGNKIIIKVKKKKDKVNLIIEGPKSVSENIITEMEAKEVIKTLKKFFSQKY